MLHQILNIVKQKTFSIHLCSFVFMTNVLLTFSADTCEKDKSTDCKCVAPKGVIDLSKLVQTASHEPLFKDIPDPTKQGVSYSYRPCLPFTEGPAVGTPCSDVAACQKTGSPAVYYNLGTQKSAKFVGEPETDSFSIQYSATDLIQQTRTTIVNLVCDRGTEKSFSVQGELTTRQYTFTLRTKYACFPGLSVGSILLIVFFVLLLVYIIGGILFLRFARGARGVEQIPNYDFWKDLPFLIKDGVMFIVRGCKAEGEQTYDRI